MFDENHRNYRLLMIQISYLFSFLDSFTIVYDTILLIFIHIKLKEKS